jgi:hypothetical protein
MLAVRVVLPVAQKILFAAIRLMITKTNSFSRATRETDCYAWPSGKLAHCFENASPMRHPLAGSCFAILNPNRHVSLVHIQSHEHIVGCRIYPSLSVSLSQLSDLLFAFLFEILSFASNGGPDIHHTSLKNISIFSTYWINEWRFQF